MARKPGIKRRLEIPAFETWYFPPFQNFCELLRFPVGPIAWIDRISHQTGKDLTVGRSTVAKLTTDGVSESSFQKIVAACTPDDLNLRISPWFYRRMIRLSEVRSNYANWCGPVEGIKQGLVEDGDTRTPLFPMIRFLEERAKPLDGYITRVLGARRLFGRGQEELGQRQIIALDADLFRAHSVVPHEVINAAEELLTELRQPESLSKESKLVIAKYCLHQYWDFFLSATALLEALGRFVHKGEEALRSGKTPFMIVFDKFLSEANNSPRNCFEGLLDNWKNLQSNDPVEQSWTGLAKGISIDPTPSPSGYSQLERQKSHLKEWRKGKSYPSEQRVKGFLRNLFTGRGFPIDFMSYQANVARALDEAIELSIQGQAKDGITQEEVMAMLTEIFSNYSLHYERILSAQYFEDWKQEQKPAA